MKKLAALFLSLAMVWSLAACSSATLSSEESGSGTGGASSGKTLVVYYSATGNTEAVANYIADATGGDLFELEPVEPYTDEDLDWTDDNSRVSQEYEDESLREVELVSATVDGFENYSVVYLGYPKLEQGFTRV